MNDELKGRADTICDRLMANDTDSGDCANAVDLIRDQKSEIERLMDDWMRAQGERSAAQHRAEDAEHRLSDLLAEVERLRGEAVPVAWMLVRKRDGFVRATYANKPTHEQLQIAVLEGDKYVPLYTAPPAPAVPDDRPLCYSCGCRSDAERNWMGRSICSKCRPAAAPEVPRGP